MYCNNTKSKPLLIKGKIRNNLQETVIIVRFRKTLVRLWITDVATVRWQFVTL